MSFYARWTLVFCAVAAWWIAIAPAQAQDKPVPISSTAAADPTGNAAASEVIDNGASHSDDRTLRPIDRGDNAWMLTSSALVLIDDGSRTGDVLRRPGAQEKRARRDDAVRIFDGADERDLGGVRIFVRVWRGSYQQRRAGMQPWIGNGDHLFIAGIGAEWREGKAVIPTHPALAIPWLTHMLFQGMFFIITPAMICGAFAERMKFSTMVVFTILWGTLVYLPVGHWVWGGGMLAFGKPYAIAGGALDFAGGTVVHISSGVSALVVRC